MTGSDGIQAAMAELGIDPSTLDEGSDLDVESESTEAQEETNEEVVETEPAEESDLDEDSTLEADKTVETELAPTTEVEQKLTPKEIQEIEAAKKDLSAKELAFTERQASMEKEFQQKYHEKLKVHDQFDDFLGHLAEKDPEFFALIQAEFKEHEKQYSNPVIEQLKQQNQEISKKLDSFMNKASDEVTRAKLDSEMKEVKASLGKDAESAGIKVDWTSVEDAWADNPKLQLKDAFFAKYGEQLVKAATSKAKVVAATKKVESLPKVNTAGTTKTSNATVAKDFKGMSTRDVVAHFAKNLK